MSSDNIQETIDLQNAELKRTYDCINSISVCIAKILKAKDNADLIQEINNVMHKVFYNIKMLHENDYRTLMYFKKPCNTRFRTIYNIIVKNLGNDVLASTKNFCHDSVFKRDIDIEVLPAREIMRIICTSPAVRNVVKLRKKELERVLKKI